MTFTIIAETDDFIVVEKPAGLIVHSDRRTEEPALCEMLAVRYPEMRGVGDVWRSPQGVDIPLHGIVHRLDRSTSGVMIFAKTPGGFDGLRSVFRARRVEKAYEALVEGVTPEQGIISAEIVRTKTVPKHWEALPRPPDHRRTALTDWQRLRSGTMEGHPVSHVHIEPRTGRTHQIRVHFSHVGHPLVGDMMYGGSPVASRWMRPALHATRISFVWRDAPLTFVSSSNPLQSESLTDG